MSKRRKKQLKARKPFQTVFLRKGEPRWGKKGVVAREGHTISEASYNAARRRQHDFGDGAMSVRDEKGYVTSVPPFKDHLPPPKLPTAQEFFRKVFGEDYPDAKSYLFVNNSLRLYYNTYRTKYRFVQIEDLPNGQKGINISIAYTSVSSAMMCVSKITWTEFKVF